MHENSFCCRSTTSTSTPCIKSINGKHLEGVESAISHDTDIHLITAFNPQTIFIVEKNSCKKLSVTYVIVYRVPTVDFYLSDEMKFGKICVKKSSNVRRMQISAETIAMTTTAIIKRLKSIA